MTKIQEFFEKLLGDKKQAGLFSAEELKSAVLNDLMVSGLVLDTNDSLRPYVEFVGIGKEDKEYENSQSIGLFDVLSGRYTEGFDSGKAKNIFKTLENMLIDSSRNGGQPYNYGSFYQFRVVNNAEEKNFDKTVEFYDEIVKALRDSGEEIPGVECVNEKGQHRIPAIVSKKNGDAVSYSISANFLFASRSCSCLLRAEANENNKRFRLWLCLKALTI